MKLFNKYAILLASSLMLLPSCNDFLDKTPIAAVTPDTYLWSDADLGAYALKQYSFTTHQGAGIGIWAGDNHTDNQATSSYDTRWVPGEWLSLIHISLQRTTLCRFPMDTVCLPVDWVLMEV